MNTIIECNRCVCELVCKYKDIYKRGIDAIMNTSIKSDEKPNGEIGFWTVKGCPHIEVSIKCPHMIAKAGNVRNL